MDERKQCKRDVNSHLKRKRAEQIRKQIQRCDNLIQKNHPHRFRSSHQVKSVCSKLLDSEGKVITDTMIFSSVGLTTSISSAIRNRPQTRFRRAKTLLSLDCLYYVQVCTTEKPVALQTPVCRSAESADSAG